MILNVIIESTDPIEIHEQYEKAYWDSDGGMREVEFSGIFRFSPGFKIHRGYNDKTTEFNLRLVNAEQKIKTL